MTDEELAEIEAEAKVLQGHHRNEVRTLADDTVALVAEVARLHRVIAECDSDYGIDEDSLCQVRPPPGEGGWQGPECGLPLCHDGKHGFEP